MPYTLPVNYTELQSQRVGCVRYARTRSVDWRFAVSTFNFVEASAFRRPPMSSENVSFDKVKTLKNKPFLLQHPNHKQKSYGALSQKLHCRRHILFHRQTRRPEIAPACRKYRLIACSLYGCVKNNIPLKPSPYACCRTIFTPFGRSRPTMRIIPYAGGWLKPNSPHISLVPKTCPPANSGGTNAVFGNGVFTDTPCVTKRICNVAQTISISIPSNMDCAAMFVIGSFRRFTVMYGTFFNISTATST